MIDTHIHVVPSNLVGAGSLSSLLVAPLEDRAAALRREMQQAGVSHALAMGSLPASADDPLGVTASLQLAALVPGLNVIGVADPLRTDPDHLRRAGALLAGGQVRALKAYLGYVPFPPDHPGYRPYYELAERHRVPFVFHTGDTYSPRARLRFVLAHLGNPWLMDGAEVVYKNVNVWADLSGLAVGDEPSFTAEERRELLDDIRRSLRRAFLYAERPNRFLYGSDWPLVPMTAYRDFIAGALPAHHHEQIFEDNARALFRL
jgi:hypothetical protein